MKITVARFFYTDTFTISNVLVDGKKFCYALEDVARPIGAPKVFGATAIPTGVYKVVMGHSERFGRDMPRVLDVPGFEGILIHAGNTDKDTHGCILLGLTWDGKSDFIGNSQKALGMFIPVITKALSDGQQVFVEVCNAIGEG